MLKQQRLPILSSALFRDALYVNPFYYDTLKTVKTISTVAIEQPLLVNSNRESVILSFFQRCKAAPYQVGCAELLHP